MKPFSNPCGLTCRCTLCVCVCVCDSHFRCAKSRAQGDRSELLAPSRLSCSLLSRLIQPHVRSKDSCFVGSVDTLRRHVRQAVFALSSVTIASTGFVSLSAGQERVGPGWCASVGSRQDSALISPSLQSHFKFLCRVPIQAQGLDKKSL